MKAEVQTINGQSTMKIIAQNPVDETLLTEFFNKKNHTKEEYIRLYKKSVCPDTKAIKEIHIIKDRGISHDELKK